MRILYCNKYNFNFSGTEAYLFEVMDLMRSRGHEIALFSMADARGAATPYDRYFLPQVDFKHPDAGLAARLKLAVHAIYSRDARQRLRQLLAEFRPDVAHVRNIYHHLSPSILWELKAQRVPVMYHLNDFKLLCPAYNMVAQGNACERCRGNQFWHVVTDGCYPGPRSAGAVLAAEAYVHSWLRTYQRCVDCFLAPSQFVKEKLVAHGWDGRRIEVLPHFQRLPLQNPPEAAGQAPVLYFGRLSPEKGIFDLLRAMQRLPRIPLQIAGDGPQRGDLERYCVTLGLSNVTFLGHLRGEELDRAIAACRFSVLPSRAYETLGKSILESYAQGRPVIASDLGSRRELVKDGTTGLLYSPGNIEQLAGAISFLYDRKALTQQMGAAGRAMLAENHSPERHEAVLTGIYSRLASTRTGSATVARPRLPRVAFIGGRGVISQYSGIEAYYEEVGARLAQMGLQVTVYCRSYFTPSQPAHRGMNLVRLPTVRSKHLETVVHTALATAHAMLTPADIVHYHALGPALFSFLPRLLKKRTVVTVQGLDWQRKKWGRLASAVLQLGERAAARLPDATMTVSRTLQDYYRAKYGVETDCVPNGAVMRIRRTAQRLAGWGLEPENYILYMGRLSPEKNCHLLVEAYERLDTPAKLVLAGGSSYSGAYQQQMLAHQSNRIRFLDWVSGEALDELLTHALLFVLPSDLEGLSLALLDAMGAGVCVLVSDIPENCEVVEGAGFTFRRGDGNDLERMLRLILSEPEVRSSAALAGQARVIERYAWDGIADAIRRIYLRVLGWPEPAAFPFATGRSLPQYTRLPAGD